ncbi:MAG: hypothetical protein ACKVOO_07930 [Burkholderiaceae bacterium]
MHFSMHQRWAERIQTMGWTAALAAQAQLLGWRGLHVAGKVNASAGRGLQAPRKRRPVSTPQGK